MMAVKQPTAVCVISNIGIFDFAQVLFFSEGELSNIYICLILFELCDDLRTMSSIGNEFDSLDSCTFIVGKPLYKSL